MPSLRSIRRSGACSLAFLVLALSGCFWKYGLAGGGLPSHVKTMAIQPFDNETPTPEIQKDYDVAWAKYPGWTTRTSYVIDKSGKIVMVHDDLDFSQHVAKTLAAVTALKH